MNSVTKQVALQALSAVSRPSRTLRRERLLRQAHGSLLCINIGAGASRLDGWLNTDIHWQAQAYLDLLRPWPNTMAGRVDLIYADNVIEHFRIPETRVVLAHAYQALKPGGAIRLATPDVEAAARAYLNSTQLGRDHLTRHRNAGYAIYHDVDLLRVVFAESGHHLGFCFDFTALSDELARAGFVDIKRMQCRVSSIPEFCDLETRNGPTDDQMTLVVEAHRAL